MANATFFPAFEYKWAQDGSIYNWEDTQYKTGWATIGAVPPSVEQFNRAQQILDEKANWLYRQISSAAVDRGITLSAIDDEGLKKILRGFTPQATASVAGIAKISTPSLVADGASNDTIITPALLATIMNRRTNWTANDYIRIPNIPGGLIIQWGKVYLPDLGGGLLTGGIEAHTLFNFNIAFPRWVGPILSQSESTQNLYKPIRLINPTLTKFELVINEDTPTFQPHWIHWLAIGG